jgi:hypothetical protein
MDADLPAHFESVEQLGEYVIITDPRWRAVLLDLALAALFVLVLIAVVA